MSFSNFENLWPASNIKKTIRVISDNDYSGDPDGLLQLAHLYLSDNVDIRGIIGSHLREGDRWAASQGDVPVEAVKKAKKIAQLTGRAEVPVAHGSRGHFTPSKEPLDSEGVELIIKEAMRKNTDTPLFITCGAGLTDLASAYLKEPRIADHLTLVWIGGREYDDLAEVAPGAGDMEYNMNIDPISAQIVFNESTIKIWQIPRNVYRQALVTRAEMITKLAPQGDLGAHLFAEIAGVAEGAKKMNFMLGDTYVIGDSPLVLVTALQSSFEPDAASSSWVTRPSMKVEPDGTYSHNEDGRSMRIYTRIDMRLLWGDFIAKLILHAQK